MERNPIRILQLMKLKQYLTEAPTPEAEIESKLLNDCMPFINEYRATNSENMFLRGANKTPTTIDKLTIRKNRLPKDTIPDVHDLMNKIFKKEFGIKLRSESLFVTSDAKDADRFGNVSIVVPIGKYDIYWSPKVDDLTNKIPKYTTTNVLSSKYFKQSNKQQQATLKQVEKLFIKNVIPSYRKGDLPHALSTGNEIMLVCKQVYVINMDYDNLVQDILDDNSR